MDKIQSNLFQIKPDESNMLELVHYFEIATLDRFKESPADLHKLPYQFCKKKKLFPYKADPQHFFVATSNPFRPNLQQQLKLKLERTIVWVYAQEELLNQMIDHYYAQTHQDPQIKASEPQAKEEAAHYQDLLDQSTTSSSIIQTLNNLIMQAIQQHASDIHFEPQEEGVYVYFRVDGVLQKKDRLEAHNRLALTSRLKLMANLDIAETRQPQDGRIKLKMGQKEIDFRVSTLPITTGERLVLRILDQSNLLLNYQELGISKQLLPSFEQVIQSTEGIILVTGPTGSGKTTTLYSIVRALTERNLNIMTIEDPVEYKLPNIAQMNVNPKIGLTFASGLRHILRQDPDVILIGEIRDLETAQIAIQAALTGHLVLSTLHTNDAPSAITRLVDMGIQPYLLSSCLLAVLAQRLIRLNCPYCLSFQKPQSQLSNLKDNQEAKGLGCPMCFETGYLKRKGIFELMPVSNPMRQLIASSANSHEIKTLATSLGMQPLYQQGMEMVQQHETTYEELLRLTLNVEDC